MILLADIQPLSIPKINIFHQRPGFIERYVSSKAHASKKVPVQTTLRKGVNFRRLTS